MLLTEFLKHPYTNLEQIYKLVKDKLPIYKDAIYSDPECIVLLGGSAENKPKFVELNKYLAKTYNAFISNGNKSTYSLYDAEDAETLTRDDAVNEAIVKYLEAHPELDVENGISFTMYRFYGLSFNDQRFNNEHAYYHIAETPPKVILKTGLKAREAVYRNDQYSYNPAVFMFSIDRATQWLNNDKDSTNTAAEVVGHDMSRYHGGSDTISYVYKVNLPKDIVANTDIVDWVWHSAVYVNENIKPEYIECIGYYQPRNSHTTDTEVGYFTGSGKEVNSFTEIVTADDAMTNVELKTSNEFTAETYAKKVYATIENMLPKINEIIKPIRYYGIDMYDIDNRIEEKYKLNMRAYIAANLQEKLSVQQIVEKIKQIIIEYVDYYGIRSEDVIARLTAFTEKIKKYKAKLKEISAKRSFSNKEFAENMYDMQSYEAYISELKKEAAELRAQLRAWTKIKEQIEAL